MDFYQSISSGYLELAKMEPERWRVINAELRQSAIASEIWNITKSWIEGN